MTDSKDPAALQALVADVGEGNVIDAELLEGCSVAPHELDEMDEQQAVQVAAHCFSVLFDHKVEQLEAGDADPDEGVWTGHVEGFPFAIRRDDFGDLEIDFLDQDA